MGRKMSLALKLYQKLTETQDDKERAKILAEALSELEERLPGEELLKASQLRETELRLQREIKEVEAKLEIKLRELEAKLEKEIQEVEASLRLEIEQLRKEMKELEGRISLQLKEAEIRLQQALKTHLFWTVGLVGALLAIMRALDALLT